MTDNIGKAPQGDHATGEREAFTSATMYHHPPNGTKLTDVEKTIWKYLMKSRDYKSWTPNDLNTCAKVVKLETILRAGQRKLEEMIEEGGDPMMPDSVCCGYNENLQKSQRQQLALLRSLGFARNSMPSGGASAKRRAERERDAAQALDEGGLFGLATD